MSQQRILGLVLLVGGLVLLYFGLRATDSFKETVSHDFRGRYTDKTTWYIVGGAAASIAGLAIMFLGGRSQRV